MEKCEKYTRTEVVSCLKEGESDVSVLYGWFSVAPSCEGASFE